MFVKHALILLFLCLSRCEADYSVFTSFYTRHAELDSMLKILEPVYSVNYDFDAVKVFTSTESIDDKYRFYKLGYNLFACELSKTDSKLHDKNRSAQELFIKFYALNLLRTRIMSEFIGPLALFKLMDSAILSFIEDENPENVLVNQVRYRFTDVTDSSHGHVSVYSLDKFLRNNEALSVKHKCPMQISLGVECSDNSSVLRVSASTANWHYILYSPVFCEHVQLHKLLLDDELSIEKTINSTKYSVKLKELDLQIHINNLSFSEFEQQGYTTIPVSLLGQKLNYGFYHREIDAKGLTYTYKHSVGARCQDVYCEVTVWLTCKPHFSEPSNARILSAITLNKKAFVLVSVPKLCALKELTLPDEEDIQVVHCERATVRLTEEDSDLRYSVPAILTDDQLFAHNILPDPDQMKQYLDNLKIEL